MSKKVKKIKKKKLSSIPKINRKLFKLWSEAVRSRSHYACEFCGVKKGEIKINGKPVKIDAHHMMNRDITNCPLKFEINNGIALCDLHHKFSPDESFHMNPVVTMNWVQKNRPDSFFFILNNYKVRVNLQSREILAEIEKRLVAKESLNLDKLKEIDQKEKSTTTTTTTETSLFDVIQDLTKNNEISKEENNHS